MSTNIARKKNMYDEIDIVENYLHLAPISNINDQETYIHLLNKAIDTKEVKNIALTGAYGSGKSSIVKTFFDSKTKEDQEKILEISLANFKEVQNDETPEGILKSEQLIEKSILQQIIYKVNHEDVPYSRFARIHSFSHKYIIGFTLLLFTWIVSLYFYLNNDKFIELFQYEWVKTLTKPFTFISEYFVLHTTLIITTFILLFLTVKYISRIKLSSISLKGADLKIDATKGSLLNEHIEEILYFFEETPYEIVFIEDLDRHKSSKIFQKLRELNTLINGYQPINKKKKVTFVYAVKDSLFTGEERTKFFEWIIPVVPVINTTTAKDKLIARMKNIKNKSGVDLLSEISLSLLKEISYYIMDLRQLNNMLNEYLVYRKLLDGVHSKDRLFSMVTYKNLFPLDFAKLHKGEGVLYEMINSGTDMVRTNMINSLIEKKEEQESLITNIEGEPIENIEMLKGVLLVKFLEQFPATSSLYSSQNRQKVQLASVLTDDNLFDKFVQGNYFTHIYNINGSSQHISYSLQKEYDDGIIAIKNKSTAHKQKIQKAIENINLKIKIVNKMTLQQLLQEGIEDVDIFKVSEEFKKEKWGKREEKGWELVVSLLRKGMIDESYRLYISYFYETEMSHDDFKWVQRVKDRASTDIFQKISNVNAVIEDLSIYDFEKISVLNQRLLEHFITTNAKNEDIKNKKNAFYHTLFTCSEEIRNPFLYEVISDNDDEELLLSLVQKYFDYRTDFWKYIEMLTQHNKKDKVYILLKLIFENISNEEILALADNNKIATYIEEISEFMSFMYMIDNSTYEKLFTLMEGLGVRFRWIKDEQVDTAIMQEIINRGLYVLTQDILKMILIYLEDMDQEVKNLSFGELSQVKDIERYLIFGENENTDAYIKNILIDAKHGEHESIDGLTKLLNHEKSFPSPLIGQLIEMIGFKIKDISTIHNKGFWDVLFTHNKIEANWENVGAYYNDKGELNNILIEFLNDIDNAKVLSKTKIDKKYKDENPDFNTKLFIEISSLKELDNEQYDYLTKSSGFWYDNLDINELENKKVDILIKNRMIQPTINNLSILKDYSNEKHILFIEKNLNRLLELTKSQDLNLEELHDLLEQKDYARLIVSKELSNDQKTEFFNTVDIQSLQIDEGFAEKIIEIYRYNIDLDLLRYLIPFLSKEKQLLTFVSLLRTHIDKWSCQDISEVLGLIGQPYSRLALKGSYLHIALNSTNKELVEILDHKDCISSKTIKKDKIRVNRYQK